MNCHCRILLSLFAATCCGLGAAAAQQPAADAIAAVVDGEPIYVRQVDRLIDAAAGGRTIEPQAEAILQAQALEQTIQRRLVRNWLNQQNIVASDDEIADAQAELQLKLKVRGITLQLLLTERGLSIEDLRDQLGWEVAWNKYTAQQATDEALEQYFQANRRQYDGTQLRCSHILLRPEGPTSPEALQALVRQAAVLREQIASGSISFAEAARRFSAGPSRRQGGDLGFIARHGQMVEAFSKAAFELEPGGVSQPVLTPFGVHLIQRGEEQPGDGTWNDVRAELQTAFTQQLFSDLAARLRAEADVKYTGNLPYIDPATGKLMPAQ